MPVYSRLTQDFINFFLQETLLMYLKLASKIWCHFVSNSERYDTISAHVPKRVWQLTSVYRNGIYISIWNSRKYSECFFMFRAILKTANSSFQKGKPYCRSIYVKKVMKLRGSVKKVLKTPVSEQRFTSF